MKTFYRHLRRVEEHLGSSGKSQGVRIVVSGVTRDPVPDNDTCVKILEECGYVRATGGVSMVAPILPNSPSSYEAATSALFHLPWSITLLSKPTANERVSQGVVISR